MYPNRTTQSEDDGCDDCEEYGEHNNGRVKGSFDKKPVDPEAYYKKGDGKSIAHIGSSKIEARLRRKRLSTVRTRSWHLSQRFEIVRVTAGKQFALSTAWAGVIYNAF